MKKINILKIYHRFLEKHKHLVGFGGWRIVIATSPLKNSSNLAEVCPDRVDKTVRLQLSQEFFDDYSLTEEKKDILLHELIHGRVALANAELRDQRALIEEDMVNDLTRGLMKIIVGEKNGRR